MATPSLEPIALMPTLYSDIKWLAESVSGQTHATVQDEY
jgi:hypothetical protein